MKVFAILVGLIVVIGVLWESFEAIVLPRKVARRFRFTRLFYRSTWQPWVTVARWLPNRRRESFLGYFGPLSLLFLLAFWAVGLVIGFGLLEWAAGLTAPSGEMPTVWHALYFSGTTFFTLGLGDVAPVTHLGKFITVAESGTGLGFLALVIGYMPVIYQAFSRREVAVSLLDARAGSPPTAGELLRRHADSDGQQALRELLHDWERWSAEILESHLSYPIVAYFRSQHSNQSWLAALVAILDTSAIARVGLEGACQRQAILTFAIARHAVVDLAQVFSTPPRRPPHDRLSAGQFDDLVRYLETAGLRLDHPETAPHRLAELRRLYEPYVHSLSLYLRLPLPPWTPHSARADNWQTSAWEKGAAPRSDRVPVADEEDGHF
ncbi:MAG TPA: ion channel [Candidatus Dormibacteraeota bacterium]|nr:ion channel [Candidatus Dormibacteraeota bacterium]